MQFDIANSSMIDRQALKEACYTRMERSLILSGATAIEDRLQVTGGTSHASVLCRAKGAMHGVDREIVTARLPVIMSMLRLVAQPALPACAPCHVCLSFGPCVDPFASLPTLFSLSVRSHPNTAWRARDD